MQYMISSNTQVNNQSLRYTGKYNTVIVKLETES